MLIKVKRISIKAFRGIPDLDIEIDGKNLLLKGENASGKSSIVDAIQYFFSGGIKSLEGVSGLSIKKHAHHINSSSNDLKVELSFNPGNIRLYRTFFEEPAPPHFLEDYFRIAQHGTFILRRSQILEFIRSIPSDRFRAIGNIIGIGSLDEIEMEMMRLRDYCQAESSSTMRRYKEYLEKLSELLGRKISSAKELNSIILNTINTRLKESDITPISSLQDIDVVPEQLLKGIKNLDKAKQIANIGEIKDAFHRYLFYDKLIERILSLNNKVAKLLEKEAKNEVNLLKLLEQGEKVVGHRRENRCPLCLQNIRKEDLLLSIKKRLDIHRQLSNEFSEIERLSKSIIRDLDDIILKVRSILPKFESFPELKQEETDIRKFINSLEQGKISVDDSAKLEKEINTDDVNKFGKWAGDLQKRILSKGAQILQKIQISDDDERILKLIEFMKDIKSCYLNVRQLAQDYKKQNFYFELAEKIYSTFSEIKKRKIQETYDSIEEDVNIFYSILHPDSSHENIRLNVLPEKRASTELKVNSFGKEDEDPRAYLSEGQLDSLGLCIFLAFVKKFNEDCPLIVLDDVVTTIDAGHRQNICEILFEVFNDKQLFVTTHDEVWFEEFRGYQHRYKKDEDYINLSIVGWDIDFGPRIQPYKPRWEKIEEAIRDGDKSGAGNKGRQYLEWVLKRICHETKASVPFDLSAKYTIENLFFPAKNRIKNLIDDEGIRKTFIESFEVLESSRFMANILSHNNSLTDQLSINEVERFCVAVLNLHKEFSCIDCGYFLSLDREKSILRCGNPKCDSLNVIKCK